MFVRTVLTRTLAYHLHVNAVTRLLTAISCSVPLYSVATSVTLDCTNLQLAVAHD